MSKASIRERLAEVDPVVVDAAVAVALAAAACLQIYLFSHFRPHGGGPPVPNFRPELFVRRDTSVWPYVLAAASFLPLAVRRRVPWLALGLSGSAALAYSLQNMPPSPVALGPMIALFTLAAYAPRRRTGLVTLLAVGVVAAVPIFAFSSSVRWVAEIVGVFVLLAAAALLGEAERNRREYISEVESRALEAERTREEEALRRVDEERIRIAREVHDIVAHSLSIVTVQAGAAAALLDADPERARESIENVRTTGKKALAELRSALDVLRTGDSDAPLTPAADVLELTALIDPVRKAGVEVALEVEGDTQSVPAFASVSAYRIVQEALTNIVRHSGAKSARIELAIDASGLTIVITDDGAGSHVPAEESPGHGIRGMRERIDALGGSFSAGPADDDAGFRVAASIPLTRSSS